MKTAAILVVHGEDTAAVRRIRALAAVPAEEADGTTVELVDRPLFASSKAGELDPAALEPLARELGEGRDFYVVHLLPEQLVGGDDPGDLVSRIGAVRERLLDQFPGARRGLIQWCVLQVGRDIDPREAELLVQLDERRTELALRGALVVPTTVQRSIAADDVDEVAFTADVVYSLLQGKIADDVPGITVAASTSIIHRPLPFARAVAARLAADYMTAHVLRLSDSSERHREVGARRVKELDLPNEAEQLLGTSRQDLIEPLTKLKEIQIRDRPAVVLASAEETALVDIPEVMRRCRVGAPLRSEELKKSIRSALDGYLQDSGRTRASWEFLQGVAAGLDATEKELADLADRAYAPALDAAYHEAAAAARDVPSSAATGVKTATLAALVLVVAALPGMPMQVPALVAAALAILAGGGGFAFRAFRRRRAAARLLDLQTKADQRGAGLIERGAFLLVRGIAVELRAWVGDVDAPLADAITEEASRDTLAGQMRRLHADAVAARDQMKGEGGEAVVRDLEASRYSLVLPETTQWFVESPEPAVRTAIAEAKLRVGEVFGRWDVTWDEPQIVAECVAAAAAKIKAEMPVSMDEALIRARGEAGARFFAEPNLPILSNYLKRQPETDEWRWVFAPSGSESKAWWPKAPKVQLKVTDDADYAAALDMMTLDIESVRQLAESRQGHDV